MRMLNAVAIAAGVLSFMPITGRADEDDDLTTHKSVVKIFTSTPGSGSLQALGEGFRSRIDWFRRCDRGQAAVS